MRLLLRQYFRYVVVFAAAVSGLLIVLNTFFSDEMAHAVKIDKEQEDTVINENYYLQGYTFETNTDYEESKDGKLTFCIGQKINYSKYVVAYLEDGTDILSYVTVDSLEEVTKPGNYEITYYLNYEGQRESKTIDVTLEDKTSNLACSAYDSDSYGEMSCKVNSDCPSNYTCSIKLEDGKSEADYTDDELKELNKNKVCIVKTKVCEIDSDCGEGFYCETTINDDESESKSCAVKEETNEENKAN